LVMTEEKAQQLGLSPLGVMTGYAYAGCDPQRMGLGPVYAIAEAERRLGLTLDHADLIEINEAFAAQVLACLRCLKSDEFARLHLQRDRPLGKVPKDILNVNGGAIALGHPVGSTGVRLVLTSLRELARRQARRALVTLCVGGGQGAAIWLERL
ncbi:MAG TPA: acetyl-CoA C-acyltransferase, partial [Candidatus Saccharimonadales bacterium]|nr:acetyl-CoA C-acyltransferase [Candidatus Saccharimonadales bacterium]